jgi:hypothetical protein
VAKQIITTITDDLDGSQADETVYFSLDGVGYEIDLSSKNASELRLFLGRFQDAGTRTGKVETGKHAAVRNFRGSSTAQNTMNREQNQKIRAWAEANGWVLADRGRIPQTIIDAFETKTPNPEWLAAQKVKNEADKGRTPRKRAAAPKAEFAGADN